MDDRALAVLTARRGAEVVRAWRLELGDAQFKGAVDPVTQADREAEAVIIETLLEHRPDDGILAEEGSERPGSGDRTWIVDPLDGTVNFVHGIPQVAVSIALHRADQPVAAAIVDVFRDEEFSAARGEGATLDGSPIEVSETDDLGQALVATGFTYDRQVHGRSYATVLGEVLVSARGIRRIGSAALDLAWLACGRYDAYWEFGLAPWDLAAGQLLVEEAGGRLTDSRGDPVRPADVVASNGRVHEQLRAIVDAHRPPHVA